MRSHNRHKRHNGFYPAIGTILAGKFGPHITTLRLSKPTWHDALLALPKAWSRKPESLPNHRHQCTCDFVQPPPAPGMTLKLCSAHDFGAYHLHVFSAGLAFERGRHIASPSFDANSDVTHHLTTSRAAFVE